MKLRLIVHPERCTGCKSCMLACSMAHEGKFSETDSRVRIIQEIGEWLFEPRICFRCDDHPCTNACMFDALIRQEYTGIITVDLECCTGCGLCVDACPYGGIHLHRISEKAMVCDFCNGKPKCSEICLQEALELRDD